MFDFQTAVLYDLDSRSLGGGGRLVVADSQLEPHRAGVPALLVSLAHYLEDLRDLLARAEHVHEVDRLLDAETIAVIGCSSTPGKAAHDVPAYLQRQGYRVIPVNPFADEILGEAAYDALGDVEEPVDLVNVFRPSEEIPGILEAVRERHAERGDAGAAWLQLGISDDEAAAAAETDGIEVVQDRCLKVEHGRLRG